MHRVAVVALALALPAAVEAGPIHGASVEVFVETTTVNGHPNPFGLVPFVGLEVSQDAPEPLHVVLAGHVIWYTVELGDVNGTSQIADVWIERDVAPGDTLWLETWLTGPAEYLRATSSLDSFPDPYLRLVAGLRPQTAGTVPEPATLALLAVGVGLAGWAKKRRQWSACS